jgi:guanylate kinase
MAQLEIEHYALFDYIVVNEEVQRAFDELRSIVVAERACRERRAPLAESLLRVGRLA